jgi:mRNA-degrading endonuclease RelE of RelBE toxin-antitoxin system
MQTIIETPAYLKSATEEGLTEKERDAIVDLIARNPKAGALIPGTGGARKLRFAGRGKGKSGGYRIITFFGGDDIPVFLLDVLGKGSRADLTPAERKTMRAALTRLPAAWREMISRRIAITK